MSLIRDPVIITAVGHQMMTAGGDITYTKATLYGQDISHLTKDQLESLTSIGNPLLTVPVGISDKSVDGEQTTIALEATFTNANLKADLPYKAVGFFAKKDNGEEKLVILGVANSGAYLAAASPDGVASDALDIKVAIAIGDATDVTAVVDPAGSVTPATLNGAINKATHDLTAKIDTKVDKTDVTAQFATKADKTTVEQELAVKANSADVYTKKQVDDALSSRDTAIATKADKATVDAEISKIDFTPYAKTADVNKQIKTVTDLANSKVSADYSYSKAELDKKLLAVTTDTSGKVNADQVANMIAGKADKTAVDAELAKKDDITDVDAKINSNVTKLNQAINTKANASDVYAKPQMDTAFGQRDAKIGNNTNVINTINEALKSLIPDDTHAPALPAEFDLNNYFVGWRRSVNTTLKNMPFGWLNDTMYFQGTVAGSDGRFELALYIGDGSNTNPKIAYRFYGWGNWKPWVLLADNGDISNLQNQITNATNLANQASQKVDSTLANSFVRKQGMNANGDLVEIRGNAVKQANGGYSFDIWSSDWTASKLKDVLGQLPSKANSSDVSADISNLQSQINSKTSGTIITAYDIASKNPTKETNSYTNKWLVDQNVLSQFADAINSINSTRVPLVNGSGDDDLFAFKTNQIRLYPGNGKNCKNLPPASNTQWFTVQYVFENPNGDGVAIFRSPANEVWMVGNNGGSYTTEWTRLANSGDISNLQNIINQQNQTIQSLTSRLNNAENEINYIKANYVEGRTFPASQEAQANSWENENPQRIAFITK